MKKTGILILLIFGNFLYAITSIRVLLEKEHQIQTLPLEKYVTLVVSKELPQNWPLEAKKAQAIVSRTYVLAQKNLRRTKPYDVVNSTADQVLSRHPEKASQEAVEKTPLQVLFDPREGKIPLTFFHARCGGKTEVPENVWNQKVPNYFSVTCAYCNKNRFRWKTQISLPEIARKLKSNSDLKKIEIDENEFGRVQWLSFLFPAKKIKLKGEALRETLGYENLKSTHFEVTSEGKNIAFSGVGFGHGVGLCQWGAKHLAEKGKTAEEILKNYFPKFQIRALTPAKFALKPAAARG